VCKSFPLNQNLTRANYGVYMATCVTCNEQYVGQTTNKVSTRWSSHRSNWSKPGDNEQMVLWRHHSTISIGFARIFSRGV